MANKPTVEEARLILELYNLRREPEMRKARQWWLTSFWPTCADDFMKVAMDFGSQENNWLRQVGSYWGIATAFVLNGIISETLFFEPAFCGELDFMVAKVRPFLKEIREKGKKDRKSTRLNSSHGYISYAVFCLKKKTPGPTGLANRRRQLAAAGFPL